MNNAELKGYLLSCCDEIDNRIATGEIEENDLAVKISRKLRQYLHTDEVKSFLEEVIFGATEYDDSTLPGRLLSHLELYLNQENEQKIVYRPSKWSLSKREINNEFLEVCYDTIPKRQSSNSCDSYEGTWIIDWWNIYES